MEQDEEFQIAFVKWVDSTKRGKIHKDQAKKKRLDHVYNSGLIVNEDDDEITLAFYYNWDEEHFTEDVTIPQIAIKKIRRFKIK